MNFSDIFKSEFLNKVNAISFLDMAVALGLAFAIGLFIMAVYRRTFRGIMYSRSFCISLMAMSLITTILILAVTSNIILSLGMVGALSIVRFRAAIKDPLDITFLFWSIAVGIILGAGFIGLAVLGSILIGILLTVFINQKAKDTPYLLIVNCDNEKSEEAAIKIIRDQTVNSAVKAKTVNAAGIELTLELRLRGAATGFVNAVNGTDGVRNVSLVSFNGEYAG
ncbi:MAG: DUF4956 domain-containing protein [Planctomycetia bacterium]|nr:DUF4956 domain-containing protein [Planctomycetia bacterium]